ncbi:MAG TPA: thiamine pyrophosphate-binding protein [Candidatus Baltobacteraceae bacterium]|nr:thiamine pyrophosphate-binding protein [Candidatus Baltobacteraceae bacterium]
MPVMTTGRFFAQTLEGYGVTHVFIVPAIFHQAMTAIEDTRIQRVTTHHEMAAAFMADGYARAKRAPGICMGQAVGSGNLAAGLRDAFQACSPVIAISGGPQPDSRYRYFYQIVEDFPMFTPVTKMNAMVQRPDRLPDLLRQAFRSATTGSPGPVHLEFPGRLGEQVQAEGEFEVFVEQPFTRFPAYRIAADPRDVEAAAALLQRAERPVIVAGGGISASDARTELVGLAERLSIPVAITMNGKENIPDDHPLSIGNVGTYGRRAANDIVAEADLVFFAGSRAGGLTTNNWKLPRPGTPVIQLDINGEELGRNYPAQVGLLGDARVTLQQLCEATRVVARPEWVRHAQATLERWRISIAGAFNSTALPIRPERICREISAFLPEHAVLVSDTGHAAIWTGTMVGLTRPGQRYLRCAGTLGWGLPAALGAKCALPNQPVLCFTGDGGLCYHLAELETAARAGINAVILVNNNGALQQVRKGIDTAYGGKQWGRSTEMWVFRAGTNYARVAEELGCLGIRVDTPDEIRPALEKAFAAGRPALIDVASDIDAAPAWG